MTWQPYIIGLLSGIAGGIISPFILALLQHKVIWRCQKRIEIRQRVFDTVVSALTRYAAESLDAGLQEQHSEERGNYITPDTRQTLQEARALVQAFCSKQAYDAIFDAMEEKLTISDTPNMEWERKKTRAILAIAQEIGINCGGNET